MVEDTPNIQRDDLMICLEDLIKMPKLPHTVIEFFQEVRSTDKQAANVFTFEQNLEINNQLAISKESSAVVKLKEITNHSDIQ